MHVQAVEGQKAKKKQLPGRVVILHKAIVQKTRESDTRIVLWDTVTTAAKKWPFGKREIETRLIMHILYSANWGMKG